MSDFDQEPTGWAAFAGMMMWGIAVFAFTAALAGLFNNSFIYENSALGQKWDWIWYGMFDLLTAIVAAYAGYAIWNMQRIGFILGLIFATASAGRWFLFIPGVPIWSVTMVVLWILVVYGLIRDRKHFKSVA